MKPLFDNHFAPITYTTGFLECAFERVLEEALAWERSMFSQVEDTALHQPLRDSLARLKPLSTPPKKLLLVETRSAWVAAFDNGERGSDPAGFVGHICGVLKCRGLVTTWRPASTESPQNPESTSVGFTLYAPEDRQWLNVERSISLVNDYGDWTFKTSGTVQPFEDVARYDAKRFAERFTPETLAAYCAHLGIRLVDEDFYGPRARLIESGPPLAARDLPESLAKARRELGLDD